MQLENYVVSHPEVLKCDYFVSRETSVVACRHMVNDGLIVVGRISVVFLPFSCYKQSESF